MKRRNVALGYHRRFLRLEPLEERALLSASWYVATTGSNSNAGTSPGAAFQTIQKAASVAQAGDTVYISAGTYHETVTPANSGTAAAPITYEPYQGGSVVVDGADPITGWTLYNNGANGPIYQAPMNWSYNNGDGDQVFVDGQMMNYARWPNTTLDISNPTNAVAATASTNAQTSTPLGALCSGVYTDAALDAFPANYWNGATIHGNFGAGGMETGTVTSFSPGSVTYSYLNQGYDPFPGGAFYLDGLFKALDAPAEWYLNTSTDTLYLWTPLGDSPASHVVEAKARTFGFELSGLSYLNIQGINLFACSIDTSSASTHDTINGIKALYVSSFELESAGASLDYCNWSLHMEDTGIIIQGSCNTLENSEIGYSPGNGVTLMGNNTSLGTGNVVTNNLIHDVDYMNLDCAGVNTGIGPGVPLVYGGVATSTYNIISDNTIYNSGRGLILIRNMGSGLVVYNDLYDGMLQSFDGGGIYTFQQDGQALLSGQAPGPDTVIAYNRIHDMTPEGDVGIYLDNGSNNYVVDHNLIYDVANAITLNPPSTDNLIYDNTLIGLAVSITTGGGDQDMSGTYIENNLCTATLGLGTLSDYAAVTYNLPYTTPPGFVNPAALDFQIAFYSPAVDAGTTIPGYTNGYVGSAPDIGCFEYGLAPWTAGVSTASNVYAAAVPATPLDLAATSPVASQMDLTWQNTDANATSCVVEFSTDEALFTPIACLPGSATSYVDTTLNTGYYRVRIYNGFYVSGYSNYASASSAPVLSANTIQAANFTAASGVTASGGVLTNGNVGNWAEYANVNFPTGINSAALNTAINQITVCYSSTAAGDNSIEFYADSLSGTLLGTVTTQYDSSGGFFTSSVDIGDLTAVNSIAAGYHNVYLEFAGNGNGGQNVANIKWFEFSSVAMPALDATMAADYTATGGPQRQGNWNLSWGNAINSCGNGGWVQYANMYIPAGLNQVTLQYWAPYGGDDYIQVRLDSLTNPVIAQDTTQQYTTAAGPGEVFTDTVSVSGVTAGVHDVYIDFVQNGTGPGVICGLDWFQFGGSSTAAAPSGATATPAPGLAMNVSWTNNSSETGFKIERSTDDQTFIQVGTVGPNATTFQDTGLSSGTTYYYRVCAYDQNYGNSTYSSVVSNTAQIFDLYWGGGAGTWSSGSGGWLNSNNQATTWANGCVAVFNGGAGGEVTVSGSVSPLEIDFETSGYSLSGGSLALPYAGGVVRVDAALATIASPITGGSLTKSGAGQLTLSGSSGYSGQTNILAGTLAVNGALTASTVNVYPGATVAPGNNGSGNFSAPSLQLDSGCTLDYTLGTGISGSDGLVTVNGQLGLVAGVVINITAGAQWGNGMYPLFYLPNFSVANPFTIDAVGWTIIGANLGGHIYSLPGTGNDVGLVETGNYVDLDVQAVADVWSASGGGTFSWSSGGNWQGGIAPNAVGDTALLGTAVGSGTATITLGSAQTVSGLTFSPATGGSYVLGGSNSLQLAGGGSSASISVTGGSDAINVPVVLQNNVNVTTATGSGLTISGAIGQSGGSQALTLSGSGSLALSGSDSYSGGTTVNGGTLVVNNTAGSGTGTGPVAINSGGTLTGNGTISGATSVSSGGSLVPGNGGIGTLAINNTLWLVGGAAVAMEINKTTSTSDLVQGLSCVTYGGTLSVTNLAGTLAPGDTFTLFSASSYAGSFATFNLPALAAGLSWNTSKLTVDGSISVMKYATTVTTTAATGAYGGTITATATLTSTFTSSPVAGETISFSLNNVSLGTATTNSSGVATLNGISLSGYDAGTYTSYLVASFAGDTLYTSGSTAANLTVNPAALTITADSKTMVCGTTLPGLTASYSGFVNGETSASLATLPALTTAATSTSPAGSYDIDVSGAVDANYNISYVQGTLTVTPIATVAAWNSAADGPWNWGPNWTDTQGVGPPGLSGVGGDQASFNGAAGLNVDLGNFSPSIAGLTFGSGALNYDIKSTGSGVLQLNNGSSDAAITVSAGSQTIDAPVVLQNNVNVTTAGGTSLTIFGAIDPSGGSQALTLSGSGSLTLSGTNGYTGGTTVNGGTLLVTNSGALPSGTALTVGAGGTVVFGSSLGAASQASALTATLQTASGCLTKPHLDVPKLGLDSRFCSASSVVTASPRTTFDAAQGDTRITASEKHEAVPAALKTSTILVARGVSGVLSPSVASAALSGRQVHDARHAAALEAVLLSDAWNPVSDNATWLDDLPAFPDRRHPAW